MKEEAESGTSSKFNVDLNEQICNSAALLEESKVSTRHHKPDSKPTVLSLEKENKRLNSNELEIYLEDDYQMENIF